VKELAGNILAPPSGEGEGDRHQQVLCDCHGKENT
jgi:hypothetical protein